LSKAFFYKSKSPYPAGFAKIYLQKNALMTAQRDLGNSPLSFDTASFNIFVLLNLRIMASSVQSFAMINKIFSLSQNVRYVAIYRDGKLETRSEEGTAALLVRNRIDMRSWGDVSVCIEKYADPVSVGLKIKSLIKED
jgi:hypothetical protein